MEDNKAPGANGRSSLGVYCCFQENRHYTAVFIQASTCMALSPLQAEAAALLLAAKTTCLPRLYQVTFFTDNLCLAKAVAAISTLDNQVLWEIRKHVVDTKSASQQIRPEIFHSSRGINGVGHDCANQVIRQSRCEPMFSCSNSAHSHGCLSHCLSPFLLHPSGHCNTCCNLFLS